MSEPEEDPGGRFMTPEEKVELAELAKQPQGTSWLLPILCWALTLLDLWFLFTGNMHGIQVVAFLLLLSVTLFATVKLWQGVTLKSQVLNDLSLGTLVNDRLDGAAVEHLPISSLLWTVNGEPAAWRRRLGRRG